MILPQIFGRRCFSISSFLVLYFFLTASGSDVTSIGESTSAVAADVSSKTAVVNDARQAATSSGPVKAVSHSAAASRQMDIVMAKPGELHFVVGSRDGTRQPNPAEVRHAGSSRSKKRQTFVASSMKPQDGQLEVWHRSAAVV